MPRTMKQRWAAAMRELRYQSIMLAVTIVLAAIGYWLLIHFLPGMLTRALHVPLRSAPVAAPVERP